METFATILGTIIVWELIEAAVIMYLVKKNKLVIFRK